MLGSLQTHFWAVRDYLSPVLRDSKFKETGRITPDEFVAAGDFLAYKFPTWTWEAGQPGKARDFLPKDKQYLISRNVPCLRRVSQLGRQGSGSDEYAEMIMTFANEEGVLGGGDGDDEWVATHTNSDDPNSTTAIPVIGEIPDLDDESSATRDVSSNLADMSIADPDRPGPVNEDDIPDIDDIPDMDDMDAGAAGLAEDEEEDDAAVKIEASDLPESDNLVQVRTYDCMITYDKYYQTPRMWLLGYDEQKRPLPPQSALSDVSTDHAMKTVTIEPFPHLSGLSIASVHPCKHSSVMKRFIERMDGGVRELQKQERRNENGSTGSDDKKEPTASAGAGKGKWLGLGKKKDKDAAAGGAGAGKDDAAEEVEGLRVDQYLVVFLKFMSSIVPTIEVDATTNI
ncbi:hypothetical protein JCM10212_004081 [Sporobolomyces blumeae]